MGRWSKAAKLLEDDEEPSKGKTEESAPDTGGDDIGKLTAEVTTDDGVKYRLEIGLSGDPRDVEDQIKFTKDVVKELKAPAPPGWGQQPQGWGQPPPQWGQPPPGWGPPPQYLPQPAPITNPNAPQQVQPIPGQTTTNGAPNNTAPQGTTNTPTTPVPPQ